MYPFWPCDPYNNKHVWEWASSNTTDLPDPELACHCGAFRLGVRHNNSFQWIEPTNQDFREQSYTGWPSR